MDFNNSNNSNTNNNGNGAYPGNNMNYGNGAYPGNFNGQNGNGKKKRGLGITLIGISLFIIVILIILYIIGDDEPETSPEKTSNFPGTTAENTSTFPSANPISDDPDVVRPPQVDIIGNGEDTVTLLMYVNGSNLESEWSEATNDLSEVIAGAGVSEKVNIIVETLGTKKWDAKLGISSKETQRYKLDGNGLTLLSDDMGQLDCTREETLSDFVKWGAANYPADRYMLVFWNHGGGALYGFGYDECIPDEYATLTIDEIHRALGEAGVYFDFIGMDCCIMSSLEVCCAIYDYCDYSILSEDFESGLGWYYTNWIKALYDNTSITTPELGKMICDDMVLANKNDFVEGDESIMAVVDESVIKVLYTAWAAFAYANEDALLNQNYSVKFTPKSGGRLHPLLGRSMAGNRSYYDYYYDDYYYDDYYYDEYYEEYNLEDYYEVDIMQVASSIDSPESEALKSAVANALIYVAATEGDSSYTGMAVFLPYGDSEAYAQIKTILSYLGFDNDYISWLSGFVEASGYDDYYSYDDFDDSWDGWDCYCDDYNWDDFYYYFDDDYWDSDCFGFDDFGYEDSYNYWCDDNGYNNYNYNYNSGYEDYYDDYYYDNFYYDDYYYDGYGWY